MVTKKEHGRINYSALQWTMNHVLWNMSVNGREEQRLTREREAKATSKAVAASPVPPMAKLVVTFPPRVEVQRYILGDVRRYGSPAAIPAKPKPQTVSSAVSKAAPSDLQQPRHSWPR